MNCRVEVGMDPTSSQTRMTNSAHWATTFGLAAAAFVFAGLPSAQAQISTVVFQDDFSANTIYPAKYQPDAPFFEGGVGDIHAEAGNGVMHFVRTEGRRVGN